MAREFDTVLGIWAEEQGWVEIGKVIYGPDITTISRPKPIRDTQRLRLYNAERDALTPYENLLGQRGTRMLVDRAVRDGHVPWSHMGIRLMWEHTRGRTWASSINWEGGEAGIKIYPREDGLVENWVLAHELAHISLGRTLGRSVEELAPHGREFARTYIALVEALVGREAAKALRREFRARKVRWHRKKKLTDEQRARMAAAARERFGRKAA